MKIIKGFAIFLVLSIFIICGSCVSEPEFSVIPKISFKSYRFVVTPKVEDADTLFLELDFKDGDGDLGLPSNNPDYSSTPFNDINFFLEQNGTLQEIGYSIQFLSEVKTISPVIDVPDNANGILVTLTTRDNPDYTATLPAYEFPYLRTAYLYDTIYVREKDQRIFFKDNDGVEEDSLYYTPVDTIHGNGETYFALLETFYFKPNEDFSNIDVTFELPSNATSSGFEDFDWTKTDAVISPFNERFPVLGDSGPLEGTLTYAMSYTGFLDDFGPNNLFRLKIQIKDRARHRSNVVTTGLTTLNELTKN
jgi:hypothetical protein